MHYLLWLLITNEHTIYLFSILSGREHIMSRTGTQTTAAKKVANNSLENTVIIFVCNARSKNWIFSRYEIKMGFTRTHFLLC